MQQRSLPSHMSLHSDPIKEKEPRKENSKSAAKKKPDSQSRFFSGRSQRKLARFLMWYIAEQENDQMSFDGDFSKKHKKQKIQCIQPLSKYCRPKGPKQDKTNPKRKFVAVRCWYGVAPIVGCPWAFLSDAVIFTVRSQKKDFEVAM